MTSSKKIRLDFDDLTVDTVDGYDPKGRKAERLKKINGILGFTKNSSPPPAPTVDANPVAPPTESVGSSVAASPVRQYSTGYNYQDKDGRKFYRTKKNPELLWKNVSFRLERKLIDRIENLIDYYTNQNGLSRNKTIEKFFSEFLDLKGY